MIVNLWLDAVPYSLGSRGLTVIVELPLLCSSCFWATCMVSCLACWWEVLHGFHALQMPVSQQCAWQMSKHYSISATNVIVPALNWPHTLPLAVS